MPQRSKNYTAQLESKGVPRVLWKYSGERGIGIISGLALKVTRPNEFNDPFEFSPGVGRGISIRHVRAIYRDAKTVSRLGLPTFEELDGEDDAAKFKALADELNGLSRQLLNEELDRISERYGVICLSATPRNIEMWSHYAENHRGFIIGLDHSRVAKMPLLPVVYSDRRVLFEGTTILNAGPRTNVRVWEVLLRKSLDWAHEREYRMIWDLSEILEREVNGQKWYMLPVLPEMISQVVVGVRASEAFVEELRKAIAIFAPAARIRRAHMHPRKYQLLFKDL